MIGESRARDGYASYYAEKIWALVPEVYRTMDGSGPGRDTLRAIVEVVAGQAAETRRSVDRLWEDQHIETADDWAVPYIGDLVGTRLVSALDRRARRVDSANTVRYRRRRGTPDLLDSLVRAMSSWDVVLVEGFRRLARTRHRLDPAPRARGVFTGTLPGGTADLRSPAGAEIADGPFCEFFHTLGARLSDGRCGIRKLNFHLYRLGAYEMEGTDPVELQDPGGLGLLRTFTFDPSGRDVPLFINATPPEEDLVGSGPPAVTRSRHRGVALFEWEVTHSMRCRLLGHVAYVVTANDVAALSVLANPPLAVDNVALLRVVGIRFEGATDLRRRLVDHGAAIGAVTPDWFRVLLALSLVDETGKAQLYPDQVQLAFDGAALPREAIAAGDLSNRERHPDPPFDLARALISPETGRFATVPPGSPAALAAHVLRYHYGLSGDVGAGPYPRVANAVTARSASNGSTPDAGVLQGDGLTFTDNRTYDLTVTTATPLGDVTVQAAPERRPYVRLSGGAGNPFGATFRPASAGRTLRINGGWYGSSDDDNTVPAGQAADIVLEDAAGAEPAAYDFEIVDIRHATLDPGGIRGDGIRIPPLRILVRCQINRLVFRRCITGPIVVSRQGPDDLARVDDLVVCESIVDASNVADNWAVSNPFGTVFLEKATVLGNVRAAILHASDSLVAGFVQAVNNQAGCFRFSASAPSSDARLPPRYRDVHVPIPPTFFNSQTFGDPRYAQLSLVAPASLTTGAENGSEMGAFSHLITPIRLASVRAKVDELGPAGILAQYLFEDDPLAVTVSLGEIALPAPVPPEVPPPDLGEVIPRPPPPPPPPLPDSCDDVDEPGPGPGPGDLVDSNVVVVDLGDADLGGAPDEWMIHDWTASPLVGGVRPSALAPAIPFGRVQHLLEYDARLGSRPEDQGWRGRGEAPSRFTLEANGILRFELAPGDPSFYESAVADGEPADTLHAYAVVRIDEGAALAQDAGGRPEPMWHVLAAVGGRRAAGLRAGWIATRSIPEFAYLSLDGQRTRPVASTEPIDRLLGAWHQIALECDFRTGRAITSLDGRIENEPLGWFGGSDSIGSLLLAQFGGTGAGGAVRGAFRNVVVSGGARFLRALFRSAAPRDDPVLQLGFALAGVGEDSGSARFLVRYGPMPEGEPVAPLPSLQTAATLPAAAQQRSEIAWLDVVLEGVPAGAPFAFTIERDHTHPDDTLDATLYLVEALIGPRARRSGT